MKKSLFAIFVGLLVLGCAGIGGGGSQKEEPIQEITADMSMDQMREVLLAKAKKVVNANAANISSAFMSSDKAELERQKALLVKEKECITGNTASCIAAGDGFTGDYDNAMTFYQVACVLKDTNGCKSAATLYTKNKVAQTNPTLGYLLDAVCGSGVGGACNLLK